MRLGTVALVVTLAVGILTAPLATEAQRPAKVPRIGYLFTGLLTPKEFLQGLRELGYVEGQNIAIEYRAAAGREDRLPELAAQLVRLRVDVIVAPGTAAARAAKQATTTIPIVIMQGADPVADGLVASLSRPGGNVTGISTFSQELAEKRLELLKETFPKVSRVAVLMRAPDRATASRFKEMEVAAQALGLDLRALEVRGSNDFDSVFQAATVGRTEALIELPTPLFHQNRKRIVEFAAKNRLPSIFHSRDFIDAGGLMSYGANHANSLRRVATIRGQDPQGRQARRPAD